MPLDFQLYLWILTHLNINDLLCSTSYSIHSYADVSTPYTNLQLLNPPSSLELNNNIMFSSIKRYWKDREQGSASKTQSCFLFNKRTQSFDLAEVTFKHTYASNLYTIHVSQVSPTREYCLKIWGPFVFLDAVQKKAVKLNSVPVLTFTRCIRGRYISSSSVIRFCLPVFRWILFALIPLLAVVGRSATSSLRMHPFVV